MELKHNTESIYPKLPSAPAEDEGQSYRLQRINEIHKILEGEKEERASLSKKYHRAVLMSPLSEQQWDLVSEVLVYYRR